MYIYIYIRGISGKLSTKENTVKLCYSQDLPAGFFYLIGGDDGKSLAPWTPPKNPLEVLRSWGNDGKILGKIIEITKSNTFRSQNLDL